LKSLKKGLSALLIIGVLGVCFVSGGLFYWLHHPQPNKETVVFIAKKTSLARIGRLLHHQGVIDHPFLYQLVLYCTGKWRALKAGEYLIPAGITPLHLLAILEAGKVIPHPLTIVEGETSAHVIQKLLADPRFQGSCALPPEGTLLPETYAFPRGTDRHKIIVRAQREMDRVIQSLWDQRSPGYPLKSWEEMVVLASIIEKETALEKEKPLIAAVFLNRLAQGIPLQADPTVVYALTQGVRPLGRSLTREDLKVESPYNTYRNLGLPPTPITNPSVSSMKAALHPTPTSCLYFVADGSGGHVFCSDLQEHQKNHATWRGVRKKRK